MMHYDNETLASYVDDTSALTPEAEAHIEGCDSCGETLNELRRIVDVLRGDLVWNDSAWNAPRALDFDALTERLRRDDAAAAAVCEEVLNGPAVGWPQRLRASQARRTPALVQRLIERSRAFIGDRPDAADIVAAMAVEVAEGIPADVYPPVYVKVILGQALRERAHILGYRSRHRQGLDYVARAENILNEVPAAEMERARLKLVKSLILRFVDRRDEACSLAAEAAGTFLRLGERTRYVNAKMTEGVAVYATGAVDRALEIWRSIENDPGHDGFSVVHIAHNIGVALADLGDHEAAIPYLYRSVMQCELLGLPLDCTRSRAMLGYSLLLRGQFHEAIPILRQTSQEFERLEMVWEWGIVTMELVEALLGAGQPKEVPDLCRRVIAEFTRIGTAPRATAALAYLREAMHLNAPTPRRARAAREALRELRLLQARVEGEGGREGG